MMMMNERWCSFRKKALWTHEEANAQSNFQVVRQIRPIENDGPINPGLGRILPSWKCPPKIHINLQKMTCSHETRDRFSFRTRLGTRKAFNLLLFFLAKKTQSIRRQELQVARTYAASTLGFRNKRASFQGFYFV